MRNKTRLAWRALACAIALPCLTACTTTGKSSGRVVDRDGIVVPADIQWKTPSAYGTFGQMVVRLPDGTAYAGEYRLVGEPDDMTLALFEPWRVGWPDWPLPWEDGALPTAVSLEDQSLLDRYRGLAIANLRSPKGERLRCRFGLLQPTVGLAGGGDGDCQVMPATRGVRQASLDRPATGALTGN